MNIFITGGTGGIGERIVSLLSSEQHQVVLLSSKKREDSGLQSKRGVSIMRGDILDENSYSQSLLNSDVILHMAGITHTNDEEYYYKINTEGTRRVVEQAKKYNINRFIFVSTRAVGKNGGPYGNSKRLAEEIVKDSGLGWTIIRPAEVYGVGSGEAISKLVTTIEKSPIIPVLGDGGYKIAPVHVDDVADAIRTVINNKSAVGKVYTLAGPEEMTCSDFISAVMAMKKIKKVRISVPLFVVRTAALIAAALKIKDPPLVKDQLPRLLCEKEADNSLAKADLGFNPRSIHQATW